MYLKEFSGEKKRTIMDLGYYAAMSDNVMTEEEKGVLKNICAEMDMRQWEEPVFNFETTLWSLDNKFNAEEKRKIFMEIVAIVASDQVTAKEEIFIQKLKKHLGIPDDKAEMALSIAKDFIRVTDTLDRYLSD